MPVSLTTPGRADARNNASVDVAFRKTDDVGTRDFQAFAGQLLAYAFPYRRFDAALADCAARLGAPMRVATPSSWRTFTTYSLPVSPAHRCARLMQRAKTPVEYGEIALFDPRAREGVGRVSSDESARPQIASVRKDTPLPLRATKADGSAPG